MRPHAIVLVLVLAGCAKVTNTMPNVVSPTDPVRYYDLEIPAGLVIQSVAFDVTTFSTTDPNHIGVGPAPSVVGGRGLLKVYALQKDSGEQFLLIYEDVTRRKQPGLIVRFQPVSEQQIPLRAPS